MGEEEVDDFYFSALFDYDELFPISDENYANEIFLQEVLISSTAANWPFEEIKLVKIKLESADSSTAGNVPFKEIKLVKKIKLERGESSNSASADKVCKICMEVAPTELMFKNKNCPHSFCRECLGRYIGTKVQDNISAVKCPEADCNGFLELEHCQEIIPRDVFERWGSALCEAMVLASQKFCYCPFKDCSALLIDDGGGDGESAGQTECPGCHRLFCAKCKVAWHSGIGCDEFERLGADERSREDLLLIEAANKKKWRRCSRCRFYVEKNEGCNHVVCRCGYNFCYGCGHQWSGAHACTALN